MPRFLLFSIYSLWIGMYFIAPPIAMGQQGYQVPPDAMAKLVDAPPTPALSISPNESMYLLMDRPSAPGIEELAAEELRLAGIRFNPNNFGPSRSRHSTSITIHRFDSDEQVMVSGLPENPRIRNMRWAPDSRHIAFTIDLPDHIALFVADVESGKARKALERPVNDVYYGAPIAWLGDSNQLVVRAVQESPGDKPAPPSYPAGPTVQENRGGEAPARTYQDLLKNAYDESVFTYYVNSQLLLVDLEGNTTPLTDVGLYTGAMPSPSGAFILVQSLHKPFSYLVPAYRFPEKTVVMDATGGIVKEIADLPLAESIPTAFGSVRTGVRNISWRNDRDATLYWAEAQDEGDARMKTDIRDAIYTLEAPFDGEPTHLADLPLRFSGISWGPDDVAMVTENWWTTRQRRVYRLNQQDPASPLELIFDLSTEDRYNNPGSFVYTRNAMGRNVLLTDKKGEHVYLTGQGASPEGNRPFLRKMNLKSLEQETLFQSEAPYYETPVHVFNKGSMRVLTRRESPEEPPNYFIRTLKNGKSTPVTAFPHPYPEWTDIQKEMLIYEREDGVKLSAILYTPAGYSPERDGALPTLLWAYPREFKSASNAGQITNSPYRFKSISYWGAIPYVTQGYAILDQTSMPVIGEGDDEPNDTFIEQLVMNAEAAIQTGASKGVVDPERVAIGGHSYGAFMTANLLAHSDLFRAGIARSGAYNRSLTPFGFQREQRTFWEAPEIYFAMSPFMHAEKVNEPILLIHGEADNNSGTFPIQSIRYYNALKGHGKIARLVLLPHESHGYRARESLLHMLWETNSWLETYVKPEDPPQQTEITPPTGR